GFCDDAGGGINITVSGGAGSPSFAWYRGGPINSDINFYNNPPQFANNVPIATTQNLGAPDDPTGVNPGSYTIVVIDAVGCGAYLTDQVPFADMPDVDISTQDVTKCDPGPYDGAID